MLQYYNWLKALRVKDIIWSKHLYAKLKIQGTAGGMICPVNRVPLRPCSMHRWLEQGDKLSNTKVNLRSAGTQMTFHCNESYHWVRGYHRPHTMRGVLSHTILLISLWSTIIPHFTMRKQRYSVKWLDQVDAHNKAGATFQAQAIWLQPLAVTYSNIAVGFITDSTIKARRLDIGQVPSAYLCGSNNNHQLKN